MAVAKEKIPILRRRRWRFPESEKPHAIRLQTMYKGFGTYHGEIDGKYGRMSSDCTTLFQQVFLLGVDGAAGPEVWRAVDRAKRIGWKWGQPWEYKGVMVYGFRHPQLGLLPKPWRNPRISTFGGPTDRGDFRYGQARNGAETLDQLRRYYPDLIDLGLFRKGLPEKLPEDRGISWALNPDGFYLAHRKFGAQPDAHHQRVLVEANGKLCALIASDHGPATPAWFIARGMMPKHLDMSPGSANYLELNTGSKADLRCWCADDLYGPQPQLIHPSGVRASER